MNYKILEQNGIENENVDGAAFNNFSAGGRDGIIKGVLNECKLFQPSSNAIAISTGEIIMHGFRIKLLEDHTFIVENPSPVEDVKYHLVVEITLGVDRNVSMEMFCKRFEPLVQTNLFASEQGVYQVEVGTFVQATDGTIKDIRPTLEIMSGPAGEIVPDGLISEEADQGAKKIWLTHKGEKFGTPVLIPYASGGGGGDATDLQLTTISDLQFNAPVGGSSNVRFSFFSNKGAKGTVKLYVNDVLKQTMILDEGEHSLDISDYVIRGTINVRVTVTTTTGATASLDYLVTGIDLKLSSTFNDEEARTGNIDFRFTVTGEVTKNVQFEIDGNKLPVVSVTSSRQQSYTISALSHGVHTLKVYAFAIVGGQTLYSNELNFNIISYVAGNNTTIISSKFNTKEATQGDIVSIDYIVFNPSYITNSVDLKVNGTSVQTLTVGRTRQYWNLNNLAVGSNTLSIESGGVSKVFSINIKESDFKLDPVTDQLELYLDAFGRNNNQTNKDIWTYGDYSVEFIDFNWSTNGWINDALRLNGKAKINIPFKIFEKDFRENGKTIEFELATRDVAMIDTLALISYSNNRGIQLKMNEALFQSEQSSVTMKYKDEERVRISFVVEDKNGLRLIKTFINGVMSGLTQYPADDDFEQSNPVGITVNPEGASLDLYTIRVYGTALSNMDMLNNYVADLDSLAVKKQTAALNDIFSADEVSYAKVKSKIATVILTGELPSVKGDEKNGKVRFEDPLNASRNFEQDCVIDIQGTSSQFYPRKNWKLKLGTAIDFFKNGFLEDTYTIKVNYMESSNSHNTGIAKYIHGDNGSIYLEKTPPQESNNNIRTVIDGEPIALFVRENEESTPRFYAIGDFNNDKANANILGLTSTYPRAESWEFKDNDELLCLFRTNDFSRNENAFEARYPKKNTNFTQIDAVVGWVYSTQGNLTKFKNEFEQHFNLHYTLVYYILTEVFGMVDSRAKNLFLTTWDGQIWYPVFYDLDTSFGLNNEGVNTFSYNIEYNDVIGSKNVYNGSSSVLWNNFKEAFAEEIQELYTKFRSDKILSYDKVLEALTLVTNPFSKALYNADGDAKYIGPLEEDNDSTYLYVAQGDRREHLKWWLDKRFKYMDSKYQASDYAKDYIEMRLYSPTGSESASVVPFDGKFVLKSFISQYLSVQYGANAELIKERATAEEETILQARAGADLNDKETTLYGASNIKDLGDLSNKYVGTLDVSRATKLSRLLVGNGNAKYSNTNLVSLSIGNNKLLTYLDVRNCPNLTQAIDLSGCENIKEVYATGTSTTSVTLGAGGSLEKLYLPATITNLTIKNQPLLEDVRIEGVANVSTLVIENVNESVNDIVVSVLNTSQNLSRVRLVGFYWSFETAEEALALMDKFDTYKGIDENGVNIDKAVLLGTIYVHTLTASQLAEMNERYPNITIIYDSLSVIVKFYDGDVLLSEKAYVEGDTIIVPASPSKESTPQYNYPFRGWSLDGETVANVTVAGKEDLTFYALFGQELRYYTIRFLNNTVGFESELQVSQVAYGEMPVYEAHTPVDMQGDGEWVGWEPDLEIVTGDATYTAKFFYPPEFDYTMNSDGESYAVSGIGNVTDTDLVIPNTYMGYPVTQIYQQAFAGNTDITSVAIPDNVKTINSSAFANCTSLTSVEIGKGVQFVGNYAFNNCTNLKTVYITDLLAWCNIDFSPSYGFPSYYGGAELYLNGEIVTDLIIPNGVTSLRKNVFYGYTSLTSVVIPDSVTTIENDAFRTCNNLTSVVIGNGVTLINYSSFRDCTSLTEVVIGDSVKTINDNAFNGCSSLHEIVIPNGVEIIGKSGFYNCTSLTNVVIPNSVTSIGEYTFRKCSNLSNITISNSITKLERGLLQECHKLSSIIIPDSVTYISADVFSSCNELRSIIIPPNVTYIGATALPNTRGITMLPTIPPTITTSTFNTVFVTITVPKGCGEAYKSATNWSNWASKIVEAEE